MARNMIFRLGVDASDFSKKMQQAGISAESTGKKIKKSMSVDNLGAEVAKIMGWGNAASTGVGAINAGNFSVAQSQLGILRSYRDQLADAGFDDYQFGSVSERIKELEYDLNEYQQALTRTADAEREASKEANGLGDEAAKTTLPVSKASRTLREMENSGRRLSIVPGFLRRIRDSASNGNSTLERMVRTIRNVSVVSFGLRVARGLFGELGTVVREYIERNDALQAQVNGLKASFGQSLAPAIHLVSNALSYALPYAVGFSNTIGQLMSALFGDGWTAAANGAGKLASSTNTAAKAQKEMNRHLLSFDQINKLSSHTNAGSGAGSEVGSTTLAAIDAKTPAWMERFRKSFTDLFNSSDFQSATIGGKIGMAIQNGIDWLSDESGGFDWRGTGAMIRQNFSDMIEAIDWSSAARIFGKSIGFALGTGVGLIWDQLKAPWEQFKQDMREGTELAGGDCVHGFFYGIGKGIANVGTWLWDNFLKPVIDGIKEGFGIHSPSTVFAEIGSNCMSGFVNGLTSGAAVALQSLRNLKDRVLEVAGSLRHAFSFDWKMPDLNLPHLQVNWDPVDNIVARFFGVTAIPRLSVQWFAKGGILDGAQIFGRMGSTLLGGGERGREAILPLDSNTGWMDDLAMRISSYLGGENGGDVNATINVILDGEKITSFVVKKLRNRARAGSSAT